MVGLFLGFGVESRVALLVTLPPTCYSFTARRSWFNRHQEEKGEEEKEKRRELCLLEKIKEADRAEIYLLKLSLGSLSQPHPFKF